MSTDKNKNETNKKEHADFQDQYRRSSNFPTLKEDEGDDLNIKGEGEIGLNEDKRKSETDQEKIDDAMAQIDLEEE